MADPTAKLRAATWVVHVLAVVALALLVRRVGGEIVICAVTGVLIGCGGVPAVPGRPVSLYAAFGVVTGYAFWVSIYAIRHGDYLTLVPALLLVVGAAWLVHEPGWPSAVFTGAALAFGLGLLAWNYQHRFDIESSDAETVARSVAVGAVFLGAGLAYATLGFAGAKLGKARRKKTARRAIRTPTDPPML